MSQEHMDDFANHITLPLAGGVHVPSAEEVDVGAHSAEDNLTKLKQKRVWTLPRNRRAGKNRLRLLEVLK